MSMSRKSRRISVASLLAAAGLSLSAAAIADRSAEPTPEELTQQAQLLEAESVANGEAPTLIEAPEAATPEEQLEQAEPEKSELELMREEQNRLQTEYSLMMQRQKNMLLELELERQRIQTESSFRSTQQQEELADMRAEIERLNVEAQHRRAKQESQMAEMQRIIDMINAEQRLEDTRRGRELAKMRAEAERLQTEATLANAKLNAVRTEMSEIQTEAQREVAELEAQMQVLSTKEKASAMVLDDMKHPLDPMVGDALYVSDRRISLNGPIISGTADWITSRIDYFNNQSSEKPIFIVIDSCPGGSVMEGYRIVKAVEESDAPVHVVVKSYAASMAAVITTLADHSYALPNAIILHHQMSSGMRGNLTQQKEQLETGFEWARRLADPVADKMGVSYERMVEMMYENNSDGDWEEFADKAVELKWVNHVIHEIREEGIREQPADPAPSFFFFWLTDPESANPELAAMQRDERGNPFIQLPPLRPFDHYAIHNPDNFYRW